MATKLQISRTNGKPRQFARCALCLVRQRAHFEVRQFPGHFLCVRCGLYLEKFPTKFISPTVRTKKPKNTLTKLLCKSALISAFPVSLHVFGASTTAMLASFPFVTLSALTFFDDGKTKSGSTTLAGVLGNAIDLSLYVIKRHLRVLASWFYVSVNDEVAELFESHKAQTAEDIDQVSNDLNRVNFDLCQINLRQHRCDNRFLDDLGLDHLPRELVQKVFKELVEEQLKKNEQGNVRSNEASGERKDVGNVSQQTDDREDGGAMNRSSEDIESSDDLDNYIVL